MSPSAPSSTSKMKKAAAVDSGHDEALHNAPPKLDGDPWDIMLAKLLAEDKTQCDAWKDEVQNLLLFAGLFSAVVTAFSVESYKYLKPDSSEANALVLAQVTMRLAGNFNSTLSSANPFTPTPTAIRINVFWFLSLVLSLSTVLVGITLLQWLREHQRYSGTQPKVAVGIFHMRDEALKKWRVRHFFTALPLLLQSALVLFFAGIIDFLLSLSPITALPVIVVVGITLSFFIVTTILPTLQITTFNNSVWLDSHAPPVQCPYKSPQALAFRRLATTSEVLFMFFYRTSRRIASDITDLRVRMLSPERQRGKNHYTTYGTTDLFYTWKTKDWESFDVRWLAHRGEYTVSTYGRYFTHPASGLTYDSFEATRKTLQKYTTDPAIFSSGYWCFRDLLASPNRIQDIGLFLQDADFAGVDYLGTYSSVRAPEINRYEVMERCLFSLRAERPILDLMGEIKIRILIHYLGGKPIKMHFPTPVSLTSEAYNLNLAARLNNKFWEAYLAYFERYLRLADSNSGQACFWTLSDSLLKTVVTVDDSDVHNTFHASTSSKDVIQMAATHYYRMDLQSLLPLMQTLRLGLKTNLERRVRPIYIFVCASIFMQALMDFDLLNGQHRSETPFIECVVDIGCLLLDYEKDVDTIQLDQSYGHLLHRDDFPSRFLSHFSDERARRQLFTSGNPPPPDSTANLPHQRSEKDYTEDGQDSDTRTPTTNRSVVVHVDPLVR